MAPSSSFLKRASILLFLTALFSNVCVFADEDDGEDDAAIQKKIDALQEQMRNGKQEKQKAKDKSIIDAEGLVKVAKKYNNAPLGHDRVKKYAKYYRNFRQEYDVETNGKKELLCSTMLALTPENIESVLPSIEHSDNKCDWLIIIYKVPVDTETNLDKDGLVDSFNRQLAPVMERLNAKLPEGRDKTEINFEFAVPRDTLMSGMVDRCEQWIKRDVSQIIENSKDEKEKKFLSSFDPCDLSDFKLLSGAYPEETANHKYNNIIYPKISLFYSYLPYLKRYNHIWALDGDLSLEHVNMNEFFNSLRCSWKNTPLVLQPLIADNTQPYTYLNANTWAFVNEKERQNHKRTVRTSSTGFIEIQTPIFNTYFLEFYIMSFLTPMIQPTHILGADWGFDETFCKAAKFFAKTSLYQDYVPASIDSSVPCALLVSTSIHHKNSQEVNGALGSGNKFTLSNELVRMVTAAFNSFSQGGNNQASNPVDSAKDFYRVYDFNPECLAKHGYADEHNEDEDDTNDEL